MNGAKAMKSEKSCGAIVLSSNNDNRNVLLIKHETVGPAVHLSATHIGCASNQIR